MYRLIFVGFVLALGLLTPILAAQEKDADNPAAQKLNRDIPRHKDFLKRIEQSKGAGDVIFLGDSITHGWEGQKAWQEHFGSFKPVNLGIGGDQTGHVLWRITDGHELDHLKPKAAVIMIGTNNTGGHTAEQIAGGIKAIVEELKQQKPDIKILVLGVFPRGSAGDAERSLEQITEGIKPINEELKKEKPDLKRLNALVRNLETTAGNDSGGEAEQEDRRDQRHHRQAGRRQDRVLQGHRQGVPGPERRPVGRDHAGLPAPERQGLRHLGQGDQGRYREAREVGQPTKRSRHSSGILLSSKDRVPLFFDRHSPGKLYAAHRD